MNIVNKTNSSVFWSVSSPGQGDCGTLAPGESTYLPVQSGPTYSVQFTPRDPASFAIQAQANQTVTVAVTATNSKAGEGEAAQSEPSAAY